MKHRQFWLEYTEKTEKYSEIWNDFRKKITISKLQFFHLFMRTLESKERVRTVKVFN